MFPLKNIIFDLGAVLINIDYKKTEQAFIQLGYHNFEEMYSQFSADKLFEKLEMGTISNEDFYKTILALNKNVNSTNQIKTAWNEILLDWRIESLDFLETLSPRYKLFLLSNTNAIHHEFFGESLLKETGRASIDNLFTKAYYSHQIHLRKPNDDIFEFVATDAAIIKEETLFIDDSYNNIETAKKLGFKTHLLLPNERIEHLKYELF
jgi:glucose-1-phosphatase